MKAKATANGTKRNGRDRRADTSRAKPATLAELTEEERRKLPKIRKW